MNDIIVLVKREKLTSDGDHRPQWIKAGLESHNPTMGPAYF